MEVVSTRRYEARPPTSVHPDILIDPEKSVAQVKEEEWETRKKKEITTTRQIETRVKRQVILEDGEVIVDSGPLVTTNTTEDVEQQEHTTQERCTTGDEPKEVEWSVGKDGGIVQKELNETVTRSREEIEELLETEDRQQFGDISDEAYIKAIRHNRGDLRIALAESSKQLAPQIGPRVVQHTTRSSKVVDTENTLERSELKADGHIVTEKKKTVEHEEINDNEIPDEDEEKREKNVNDNDDCIETRKQSSQRYVKTRDEDIVDYISGGEKVAREMRYVSETTEGERIGDWPPILTTINRNMRLHKRDIQNEGTTASRKDVLTKKSLDLEEEDEARKFETSKWLESHFGSDSRSSHDSLDNDDPPIQTGTNTSFINVTMKSCTNHNREYKNTNANSSLNQQQSQLHRRTAAREANFPNGYFQGISEWSERYQDNEKQQVTSSSSHHPCNLLHDNRKAVKSNFQPAYKHSYESRRYKEQHHESPQQEYIKSPSPPIRRKVREQMLTKSGKKNNYNDVNTRTGSPVHVVQRTWENRNREVQGRERTAREYSPQQMQRSHSVSPLPPVELSVITEKKCNDNSNTSRTSKSSGQTKYKIGESFRKLVGKLRSTSTERKNKRNSGSSNSYAQVTQTDDDSTYLQYNAVDRNIPMTIDYDTVDRPPERPPRSPKNTAEISKTKRVVSKNVEKNEHWHQNDYSLPVQRYYLGENPFSGSIYGREKGYKDVKPRQQDGSGRYNSEANYSIESNSLGRFSKSTSKLINNYEKEGQFRSTQTLPRKLHGSKQQHHYHLQQNINYSINGNLHNKLSQPPNESTTQITSKSQGIRRLAPSPREYGSMINISFKNTITLTPKNSAMPSQQMPLKSESAQKSSLSRSQSFNVDTCKSGNALMRQSNFQLNRLNETPPLKSPRILASISRSNRDLFKNGKHDY